MLNSTFYKDKPANDKKIESEQDEGLKPTDSDESWLEELDSIKGIGKKTVKDIINVYPTKEKLLEAIKGDNNLPFRDDIASRLIDEYQ